MAFESWSVLTSYKFVSNSAKVLGGIAKDTERATTLMDAFTKSLTKADGVLNAFIATSDKARVSMAGVERGFADMDLAAKSASGGVVSSNRAVAGSFSSISRAATRATTRVATLYATARNGGASAAAALGGVTGGLAGGGAGRAASSDAGLGPSGIAGLVALATTAIGVQQGSASQAALLRLSAQTGQSYGSLSSTYVPIALAAGNRIGMSTTDTIGIASEAAGVLKNPIELRNALTGGPSGGGLLDLIGVLQKTNVSTGDPAKTARNIITMDHILNAYQGPAMARVNESLYRAAVGSHMDLGSLVTQVGYFGEQFRLASGNRAAATDDILKMAELGYWGIGHGKWGSGFGQILRTINRPPEHAVPFLEALGVLDSKGRISSTTEDKYGQFTPLAMLAEARKRIALDPKLRAMGPMGIYGALMNNAFPANAARVFAEGLSPKTTGFLNRLDASQKSMPSLMNSETILMSGLAEQTNRLVTSFGQLAQVLSGPLIKPLTDFVRWLGDNVGGATKYFQAHPTATTLASAGLVGGAGFGIYKALQFVGAGIFGHMALHGAKDAMGIGGWLSLPRRALHGAGSMARGGLSGLWDLFTMKSTRGLIGKMADPIGGFFAKNLPGLAMAFKSLAGHMNFAGSVAKLFGFIVRNSFMGIFEFGTRLIPFVGEFLILKDILGALGKNAKNIGFAIGYASAWIKDHALPLFIDALKGLVGDMIAFLAASWRGLFNGHHGGIWDVGSNLMSGLGSGAAAEQGQAKPPQSAANLHRAAITPHQHVTYSSSQVRVGKPHQQAYSGKVVQVLGDVNIHPPTGADFDAIMKSLHSKVIRGDVPHAPAMAPANIAEVSVAGHLFGQG